MYVKLKMCQDTIVDGTEEDLIDSENKALIDVFRVRLHVKRAGSIYE